MIDIFGSLLERPVINEDFKAKYPCLFKMIETDLDQVKRIFDNQTASESEKGAASVNKNMPNVAGALKWATELRNRLKAPLGNLKLSFNNEYVISLLLLFYRLMILCDFYDGVVGLNHRR